MVFILEWICFTISMLSFIENGKCTDEIYSRRNFIKMMKIWKQKQMKKQNKENDKKPIRIQMKMIYQVE